LELAEAEPEEEAPVLALKEQASSVKADTRRTPGARRDVFITREELRVFERVRRVF
jgi:hypothetical protein